MQSPAPAAVVRGVRSYAVHKGRDDDRRVRVDRTLGCVVVVLGRIA